VTAKKRGKVYLIGAGPGDPGLLTIKGMETIGLADAIVYDYLASPALLKYARPDAEIIYVGKKGGDHTLTQDKISELIADLGKQGKTVARLKGGDPFIFGRGGEEAEVLIDAGVEFEIVPGVTSAIAAPAYAGIPLTHREHASSVSIITGHEDPLKQESSIQWECLARSDSTLVFLMGVKNLSSITGNLIAAGKAATTPVALVRWGTTALQQTVTGTLDTIVDDVKKAGLKSPAIIVVGSVVGLREKMSWFESRPLLGKTIVVTRARVQASELVEQLTALGARCIEIPSIKVVPPRDTAPLINAVNSLNNFDWVVFTSVNGVKHFFTTLYNARMDVRALGHLKFASIGPATKAELRLHGIVSDILPSTYVAESVVEAFSRVEIKGKRVLLPRAKQARTILPEELDKMGALVTEVTAYETVDEHLDEEILARLLAESKVDMVTFTSSSTVRNFKRLVDETEILKLEPGTIAACIGPITADTAADLGITPDIVAAEFTIPGLVSAIVDHVRKNQRITQ
jgi:uroporphyrinogen III methyltransferase/synthase